MKLFANPVVALIPGLFLGVAVGLGVFWHEATGLAKTARATHLAKVEPERPAKPWDFWTLEIENLASELRDQKAVIAAREQSLAAREERLANEQRELQKTHKQIEALGAELSGRMTELEADEMKNLKTLAKTYSELTPKAAVAILRELDEANAVKILFLMKSDVVSPILQEMGASTDADLAKKAARITDRLRLVKAPKSTP